MNTLTSSNRWWDVHSCVIFAYTISRRDGDDNNDALAGLPPAAPLSLKFPSDSLSNTYHAGCWTEVRRIRIFLFSSDSIYESIAYDTVKNKLLEGEKNTAKPEKKLSLQMREPKTKPTHIWRRRRDLKPGLHSWEASALTTALTTATPLLLELMYALMKRLFNQKGVGYISLALVCMMEYTLLPGSHFY